MSATEHKLDFAHLIGTIRQVHDELAKQASRAVNVSLTLRNWLIGYHIEQYERSGIDRADYGDKLMDRLAETLTAQGISRCDRRELYRYRRFYLIYPQIVEALTPQSRIDGKRLVTRLSFSHIVELLNIDDDTKRAFYELGCIQGNWSVRELKRQIHSLYYERSGLSRDKKKLAELTQQGAQQAEAKLDIRDPYIFEFLGLKPAEVMGESHLENQLLDKLGAFLLELGHGFCFEARQKRILIGDEHFFIDMVFYHRILKCHVLVELKLEKFSQENIGQLNTYVSWYRKNMMTEGDNPPVGILLCTEKNHTLAEYALAGMDNHRPRKRRCNGSLKNKLGKKKDKDRWYRQLATNRGVMNMTDFLKHWANQNEENAALMAQELLITEVTEEIWKAMEETGVNKTELANRIGVTKGYISQVLSGSRNMTLRTLSDICFALGKQATIALEARAAHEEERTDDEGRLARVPAKQTSPENEATSE